MKTFDLPDLGEGLQEAEIVNWHVGPGDQVVADQPPLAAIDRGAERSRALEVKVTFVENYPSYYQSADHPGAQRLVGALKRVHGYSDEDFVRTGSGGSTDMAFVSQILGSDEIATVGMGRSGESKAHGSNESVRLSDARAHVKELIYYFCAPLNQSG
jgi:acetylornithine deacetylase/succinyl-diaminopimelate desuccinylase-like protein